MAKDTKVPILVLSTDWHLRKNNIQQIKDLIIEQCEFTVSLGLNIMVCNGDIFDHRTGQDVETLIAFSEILAIIASYKLTLIAIPGNHDKQAYDGDNSFISPFKFHKNFNYIDNFGGFNIGHIHFHLLPYYKANIWLERFEEMQSHIDFADGDKHVLLSHIAVNGSRNNDGSVIECGIAVGDFKHFEVVLLGHYHDQQQVGKNVFHIPSIQQNNFGENAEKGFTVFYDDCTFDLHISNFKRYEKISVDFDKISKTGLESLVKAYAGKDQYTCFEFTGASDKVKSINKEELTSMGIDVKIKIKEIEDTIQYADSEIKEYTKNSIVVEFADFCEEKNKDFDEGMTYLSKKLHE
jgi:exonuclease SbcD